MAWIAPKMDWTNSDWINAVDFNRIENNIAEVVSYLNSIQYSIPAMTSVTNRDNTSIDFLSSINRIEANVESIRTHFMTPVGYAAAETWIGGKGFDYTDANRLETNVNALVELGILVYQSFVYCGTFACGGMAFGNGGKPLKKFSSQTWQDFGSDIWLEI